MSAPVAEAPLADHLDRIAERIGTLAGMAATLREENQRLQATLDEREAENARLRDRVDAARVRVERLIEHLPIG